jgi:methyltransferase
MGAVFILSNALRYWVIHLLAGLWNVQIMDSGRIGIVTSGPYRWVRHPNYVGVVLEVFSLPMIHTAWITAVVGTLGYFEILRRRITFEDRVLMANPAYREAMGDKPKFFPRLFSRRAT